MVSAIDQMGVLCSQHTLDSYTIIKRYWKRINHTSRRMLSLLQFILVIHRWFQFIIQLPVNDRFERCDMRFNEVTRGHCCVYVSAKIHNPSVNIFSWFVITWNMYLRVRSSGSFNEIHCLSYVNLAVLYAFVLCILKSPSSEHHANCSLRHIPSTSPGSCSVTTFT